MGNCASCYSNVTATATAKLIQLDGKLREFSSPVKVFLVAPALDSGNDLCSFICNADEMDFDECVTAMSGEEELRPGQIYFELPANWLNKRLAAEDMASLAVKAGAALTTISSGGVRCGCCIRRVGPLVFYDGDDIRKHSLGGRGGRDGASGGGRGRMFTRLERIAEE